MNPQGSADSTAIEVTENQKCIHTMEILDPEWSRDKRPFENCYFASK